MEYTQEQIDEVVVVTGAELFIKHVLGIYSEAVAVGMQLSYDGNGLSELDISTKLSCSSLKKESNDGRTIFCQL